MAGVVMLTIKACDIDGNVKDMRDVQAYELAKLHPELQATVLAAGAEMTSRLLPDGDPDIEFASQITVNVLPDDENNYGGHAIVRAIFFQPREQVEAREDLSDLEWTPDHYEIIY